jgi:hypothetical protein
VGFVGLGAGTLAAYGKPGDAFRFYELNPQVVQIAVGWFRYLTDSRATNAVVLGDARVELERELCEERSAALRPAVCRRVFKRRDSAASPDRRVRLTCIVATWPPTACCCFT